MCACIDHLYSEKTVTDCCALHKMLLVVFFHPRALTQCSYSTNTGSSRASLNCLCQSDTECPTVVCIPVYYSRELFLILDTVVQINDLHACMLCVCVCVYIVVTSWHVTCITQNNLLCDLSSATDLKHCLWWKDILS